MTNEEKKTNGFMSILEIFLFRKKDVETILKDYTPEQATVMIERPEEDESPVRERAHINSIIMYTLFCTNQEYTALMDRLSTPTGNDNLEAYKSRLKDELKNPLRFMNPSFLLDLILSIVFSIFFSVCCALLVSAINVMWFVGSIMNVVCNSFSKDQNHKNNNCQQNGIEHSGPAH
jgi:hypothetical protein